jgi:catechol 2,3-dioxygenase-like lactoylglutathione lyase family enzyme
LGKITTFASLLFAALLMLVTPPAEAKPLQAGFSEVVITTRDMAKWQNFLTELGGWEVRDEAPLGAEGALWAAERGKTMLLANKGEDTGFIRLVQPEDVKQDYIRADDRPWDIGGIFDFNVRVKNLRVLREKMLADGWQGDGPPQQYTFGPFEVIEWIARGPDNVRIAFIERVAPPLEGWPHLKSVSRVFNSTTIVKDLAASQAFYEKVLGMQAYLESRSLDEKPGPNLLGLPHNMANTVTRDVVILHPDKKNEGSVELIAFDGADGADMTATAKPHNWGISTLRFPVADLDASIAILKANNVSGIAQPVTTRIAPYGDIRISGFLTPDGVWLEIFEKKEP